MKHGIALVMATEGRFLFETPAIQATQLLSREQAAKYGMPTIVGIHCRLGWEVGSIRMSPIRADQPRDVRELVIGTEPAEVNE